MLSRGSSDAEVSLCSRPPFKMRISTLGKGCTVLDVVRRVVGCGDYVMWHRDAVMGEF